jgi:hypothetical protein
MQSKLGSDAAQFAAELANRFEPARSERLARDFHDRFVEILGFSRPVDSLPCEGDHDREFSLSPITGAARSGKMCP